MLMKALVSVNVVIVVLEIAYILCVAQLVMLPANLFIISKQ